MFDPFSSRFVCHPSPALLETHESKRKWMFATTWRIFYENFRSTLSLLLMFAISATEEDERSKNIFAGFIYLKWESIRSPRTTLSSGTSLLGSMFAFMCRLAYLARWDKALSHDFSDNQIAFWSTSPPNQFLFGLGLGARVRFASSSSSRLDFSLIAHIGFYE